MDERLNIDSLQQFLKLREIAEGIAKNHADFFDKVKGLLPPKPLVFYPGSGGDRTLTKYFDSANIVHMDKSPDWDLPPNSVLGVYELIPFREEVFDMLYVSDNHATEEEFNLMLDTVKKDGVVVFDSMFSCGPYTIDQAITNKRLRPFGKPSLNILTGMYQILRKV